MARLPPSRNTVHRGVADVTAAIAAVLEGVAARQLTIEEGAMLADLLERHSTIIKNDATERRLKALEEAEAKRAA